MVGVGFVTVGVVGFGAGVVVVGFGAGVVTGFAGAGAGGGVTAFGLIPAANERNAAEVSEAQPTFPIESHFALFPTTAPAILSPNTLINAPLVASPSA